MGSAPGKERPDAREAAIWHLESAREALWDAKTNTADDHIMRVLDQLTDFCAPHLRLVAADTSARPEGRAS